jgi:hypothetical protein
VPNRIRGPDKCKFGLFDANCDGGFTPFSHARRTVVILKSHECLLLAVRPEGANHQWRKNPPGELWIDPVADERLVWVTAWVGAS